MLIALDITNGKNVRMLKIDTNIIERFLRTFFCKFIKNINPMDITGWQLLCETKPDGHFRIILLTNVVNSPKLDRKYIITTGDV